MRNLLIVQFGTFQKFPKSSNFHYWQIQWINQNNEISEVFQFKKKISNLTVWKTIKIPNI